jgi:hypothetical protein
MLGEKKDMALVKNNTATRGLSGKFQSILFKTFRGKTFAYPEPKKPTRQSEEQRKNRDRFRNASYFAKTAMQDPERKEYYRRIARKLKLPNAYTAAITDYMRKTQIPEVTVSDKVQIETVKKGFKIESVNVVITDSNHQLIEQGAARLKGYDFWWYHPVSIKLDERNSYKVIITAIDQTGQRAERIVDVY